MKRILVIRGGAIGDFIVTLPALKLLRQRWPEAHLELLGYPSIAEIAHQRYYLDAVRSVDRGPLAAFFSDRSTLDPDWVDYFSEFDLVLSYFFDPDAIFATNLRKCGVPHLISASPQVDRAPAAAHFCAPLAELGLASTTFHSELFLSASDQAAAQVFLQGKPTSFVALHPGSGSPSKNWPTERWLQLSSQIPHPALWVGGVADQSALNGIRAAQPSAWIAESLPLPTLGAVLQQAHFFIGHDSGLTHLAAAVGTPSLALFGPTLEAVWAPPAPHVQVVRRGANIGDISVDDVLNAIAGLETKQIKN